MPSNKILYLCQEVAPYLPDNDESLLSRSLLQSIQERGNEIRTFMPRYGVINERRNQLHEVIRLSGMNLIIDDNDHQLIIKVASIPSARVQVYFIDNEDYFSRKSILVGEDGEEFADNDERAIFFSRGVLETVKKLRWEPTIVHSLGWFSAISAAYLRTTFADDPIFKGVKVVISVGEAGFEKSLDSNFIEKIKSEGIGGDNVDVLSKPTYQNFMRYVLSFVDGVVLTSDNIAQDVMAEIRGCGKPVLEYQSSDEVDFYDNYDKFYDSL